VASLGHDGCMKMVVTPTREDLPTVGIVADDLTGATTVGALLARVGVDAAVRFDPDFVDELGRHRAVIVSTDSRSLPAQEAFERVRNATLELRGAGATLFSKRIDSTCRGGIGPEVEGMLSALGDDHIAVVVPAMPQSRRVVVDGYSLVDSVLLSRTAAAADVRTPVTESHLPTLLAGQFTGPVGHVGLGAVLAGPRRLEAALVAQRGSGARAILVDAVSEEDIDAIASVLAGLGWPVVCVDPGSFTQRMVVRCGVAPARGVLERGTRVESAASDLGTVLVVAGSAMSATHTQMSELSRVPGTVVVEVRLAALTAAEPEFRAEADRIVRDVHRLVEEQGGPRVLLLGLESTLSGRVADLSGDPSGDLAAVLIPARLGQLGRLVADALGERLAGFYLTGGDVMIGTCRALAARGLQMVDYVIPQADQGFLIGGPHARVPVVCKGGMTGTGQTAIQCVNRIFDEKKRTREDGPVST
jgi:uncharacterized protein YgbK (DUF1537 family)